MKEGFLCYIVCEMCKLFYVSAPECFGLSGTAGRRREGKGGSWKEDKWIREGKWQNPARTIDDDDDNYYFPTLGRSSRGTKKK